MVTFECFCLFMLVIQFKHLHVCIEQMLLSKAACSAFEVHLIVFCDLVNQTHDIGIASATIK